MKELLFVLIANLIAITPCHSETIENTIRRHDEAMTKAEKHEQAAKRNRLVAEHMDRMALIAKQMNWTAMDKIICSWLQQDKGLSCNTPSFWISRKESLEDEFIKSMNRCGTNILESNLAVKSNLSDAELKNILLQSAYWWQDKQCKA